MLMMAAESHPQKNAPRRARARRGSAAPEQDETFGRRLARLRKAAGYSQRDFALEVGISNRAVAYYEAQTDRPPAKLLPAFARVLGVSADELLGLKAVSQRAGAKDTRVWRRCKKIEELPAKERRQLLQLIDAFLEREHLRSKRPAQ